MGWEMKKYDCENCSALVYLPHCSCDNVCPHPRENTSEFGSFWWILHFHFSLSHFLFPLYLILHVALMSSFLLFRSFIFQFRFSKYEIGDCNDLCNFNYSHQITFPHFHLCHIDFSLCIMFHLK